MGIAVTVLLCFGAILLRMHVVLLSDAKALVDRELSTYANATIQRVEYRIQHVIDTLSQTDFDRMEPCSATMLNTFRFVMGKLSFVRDVGIVKADGTLSCSVLRPANPVNGFLPRWTVEDRAFSLAVLEEQNVDLRPLLITVNKGLNHRIVARMAPEMAVDDFGAGFLKNHLSVALELRSGEKWQRVTMTGPADEASSYLAGLTSHMWGGVEHHRSEIMSQIFPVKVSVAAAPEAIGATLAFLETGLNRLAIWFAPLLLLLMGLIFWRNAQDNIDYSSVFSEGNFIPHYQPVIDLDTGAVVGCEVLIRFRTEEGKFIRPAAFIAYAETTGIIMDVTREMMVKVGEDMADLMAEHRDLKLSLNLTAKHFEDMRVIDDIEMIFGPTDIHFDQLVFEMTERDPIVDFEAARMVISSLQALGCSVALDDAGTGHGGFSYLQKLGMDIIKIDKMFIDTLNEDVRTKTIVDTILQLAQNLDMGIVAEGVETEAQIRQLRAIGISAAQGFYFSPALSANQYCALVRASRNADTAMGGENSVMPVAA